MKKLKKIVAKKKDSGDIKRNILKLEDIAYAYENASGSNRVLKGISAKFVSGKMYAIMGESGSGKTTLLSLIGALDKLQGGDILYNGKSLRKIGNANFRLKYVNIVFRQYNLIRYMTARENVEIAIDFDKRKASPDKYLKQVGLSEEEGSRMIGRLSGGQQQRVAIARALASASPIIIADEPTGNLDEDTEDTIIDLFKKLAHKKNKIVIIVTHSKRVAKHADEVWKLRRGELTRAE